MIRIERDMTAAAAAFTCPDPVLVTAAAAIHVSLQHFFSIGVEYPPSTSSHVLDVNFIF